MLFDHVRRDDPAGPSTRSHETYGPLILQVGIPICVVTFLVACHRLYYVRVNRGWLGKEDYMLAFAVLVLVSLTIVDGVAVANGFGYHRADFDAINGDYTTAMQCWWAARLLYQLGIMSKKLVFCLLYLRLFPVRSIQRVTHATIGVVVAGMLAFIIAHIFSCRPMSIMWTDQRPLPPGSSCINIGGMVWSLTAFDISTDLWIVVLPFPMIQRLNMSLVRRIGAMVLFALGAVCCAIAVARSLAIRTSLIAHNTRDDAPHGDAPAMIWSQVEVAVGLLCTCIVTLKQPVSRLFKVSLEAGTKLGGLAPATTRSDRKTRDTLLRAPLGVGGLQGITTTTITADREGGFRVDAATGAELGKDVWGRKDTHIVMERVTSADVIREEVEPDEHEHEHDRDDVDSRLDVPAVLGVKRPSSAASRARLVRASCESLARWPAVAAAADQEDETRLGGPERVASPEQSSRRSLWK